VSVMRILHIDATHERRAFPLALMAIATVAAVAACGSSGSKPATQAAPTQPTATKAVATRHPVAPAQKFTSQKYGFRVALAEGSSEDDATVAWNGRKLQGLDSAAFANFTDPATNRTLSVAAAPVAPAMVLAKWRAAMVRAAPAFCSQSSSAEQTTLGGEPALAWTAKCDDGYYVYKLATLHGKRGFMMFFASPTTKHRAEDRLTFDSIRRSFRFTR
jgi:predicted small lipoprotein YifL